MHVLPVLALLLSLQSLLTLNERPCWWKVSLALADGQLHGLISRLGGERFCKRTHLPTWLSARGKGSGIIEPPPRSGSREEYRRLMGTLLTAGLWEVSHRTSCFNPRTKLSHLDAIKETRHSLRC